MIPTPDRPPPPRPGRAGTHVIWPAGLRERWGISEPTLWRWRRAGKIPQPDVRIGDREGWRPETIEAFERGPAAA
jgi:hypothetical protein